MNTRPRLNLPLSPFEYTLNMAAALGIIFDAYLIRHFYPVLPTRIPTHFNFAGQPDGWGGRGMLIILPAISLALFLLFVVLERYPQIYNYPVAITEANARRQYILARTLLAWLGFVIVWFFAYIELKTIQVALGKGGGLGPAAVLILLAVTVGSIGVYIRLAYKAK